MLVLDKSASEDVLAPECALCVAVLAGLGCGDLDNLARMGFEDRVAVFLDGVGLGGVGERGFGVAYDLGHVSLLFNPSEDGCGEKV